jgi:hypothetical protein
MRLWKDYLDVDFPDLSEVEKDRIRRDNWLYFWECLPFEIVAVLIGICAVVGFFDIVHLLFH